MHEVIIIGAGPIGLACGMELKRRGVEPLLLEKGAVADAVRLFPLNMNFFSTSELIELGGVPFISREIRPSRYEAVKYYQRVASHEGLNIRTHTEVRNIECASGICRVVSQKGEVFEAKRLIFATGYYSQPNLLGVDGENLPHVNHYYDEALRYSRSKVLVVGGQNSACDTALDLFRSGASVSLVHRQAELGKSVKYWVRPDMENRVRAGEIQAYFSHVVIEITETDVGLLNSLTGEILRVEADFVFLQTGYHPDVRLLKEAGVEVDAESLVPSFNSETFETNAGGVYVAGSTIAGKRTSNIFIENGRVHAAVVADHIVGQSR